MSQVPQRIGDAERDAAIEALREHHAKGRLTIEEFDERMQTALSAKVASDLQPLFSDLPRDPAAAVEFLPALRPSGMALADASTPASVSVWRPQDEAEYERLTRLDRTLGWVHAVGWPLVIVINIFAGFDLWWLFIVMGVVVGSLHGSVEDRRNKLKKRRARAGLPPHPDDEDDDDEDDDEDRKPKKSKKAS
ncbi:DUF1707 SHOCT-like domain-containing protein [Aestuariimicrobium ganziense]|uniref:DUF1707 SHOCT-like domain-containing protein n=1 Tax=Aestuariimicrobium ganziense TaxID=2773677 RepID=UPI00194275C7|nr:DUF1707 domain-containing protein [Aestuariimicrobium ganziense]